MSPSFWRCDGGWRRELPFTINTGFFAGSEAGLAEAVEALGFIDPDLPYSDWITVLAALHDAFGDGGEVLAEEWSARGTKYVPGEVERKWRSFTPGGDSTLNSIFHFARQGGCDLAALTRKHRGRSIGAAYGSQPRPNGDDAGQMRDDENRDEGDLSDGDLARDLCATQLDADGRYVALWARWMFWDGERWVEDSRLEHYTRADRFLRARADRIVAGTEMLNDSEKLEMARRAAKGLKSAAKSHAVLSICQRSGDVPARPSSSTPA